MSGLNELRESVINETKKGGDATKAVALAIVFLGECVRESGVEIGKAANALDTIGVEAGGISVGLRGA